MPPAPRECSLWAPFPVRPYLRSGLSLKRVNDCGPDGGKREGAPTRTLLGVQRLFSTFPRGAQGIALTLLRVSISLALFIGPAGDTPYAVMAKSVPEPWSAICLVPFAAMLCVGIVTPAAALVCAVLQTLALLTVGFPDAATAILSIANAAALVVLGPGAYSIDAQLFGPRVVMTTSEHIRHRP